MTPFGAHEFAEAVETAMVCASADAGTDAKKRGGGVHRGVDAASRVNRVG